MQKTQQRARELADRYAYRVMWSEEDGKYVATCAEWPYLSWLAAEQGEAIDGLVKLVGSEIARRLSPGADKDEEVPEPISTRKYSGHFAARVPPDEHRRLVLEAAEQNVSLNQLVTMKLAR